MCPGRTKQGRKDEKKGLTASPPHPAPSHRLSPLEIHNEGNFLPRSRSVRWPTPRSVSEQPGNLPFQPVISPTPPADPQWNAACRPPQAKPDHEETRNPSAWRSGPRRTQERFLGEPAARARFRKAADCIRCGAGSLRGPTWPPLRLRALPRLAVQHSTSGFPPGPEETQPGGAGVLFCPGTLERRGGTAGLLVNGGQFWSPRECSAAGRGAAWKAGGRSSLCC